MVESVAPRRALVVPVETTASVVESSMDVAPGGCESSIASHSASVASSPTFSAQHPPTAPEGREDGASTRWPEADLSYNRAACPDPYASTSSSGVRAQQHAPITIPSSTGGGRALSRGKLDSRIVVRFPRVEHDAIRRRAEQLHTTPSRWLRAITRDALDVGLDELGKLAYHAQRGYDTVSPVDAQLIEQLRRVGVNLNQVARALNQMARDGWDGARVDEGWAVLRWCEAGLRDVVEATGVEL